MATIVHFDISAENLERAKTFYEKIFNWKIIKLPGPMNYYMITTNDLQGHPGIGGGMEKRESSRKSGTINYIGVTSISTTLKLVTEAGGKIIQPVQPIPGYGKLAICTDPEDNTFGLFEEAANI